MEQPMAEVSARSKQNRGHARDVLDPMAVQRHHDNLAADAPLAHGPSHPAARDPGMRGSGARAVFVGKSFTPASFRTLVGHIATDRTVARAIHAAPIPTIHSLPYLTAHQKRELAAVAPQVFRQLSIAAHQYAGAAQQLAASLRGASANGFRLQKKSAQGATNQVLAGSATDPQPIVADFYTYKQDVIDLINILQSRAAGSGNSAPTWPRARLDEYTSQMESVTSLHGQGKISDSQFVFLVTELDTRMHDLFWQLYNMIYPSRGGPVRAGLPQAKALGYRANRAQGGGRLGEAAGPPSQMGRPRAVEHRVGSRKAL
jgi:hypothetical protein